MITEQHIQIRDIKGLIHKWLIEEETKDSYKIFCNGFISIINKKHTYMKDGLLYTSDIRNPWCTLENKKYMKAEYCEIWKD
jgi:hypothetical protein